MLQLLGNILQLIVFLLTWRIGVAKEKKEELESLSKEASDAIASGRVSRINAIVVRLRKP